MKLIPLTQGKFAMVDDEDYEELSQFRWCAMRTRGWYAGRTTRRPDGLGRLNLLMHKVLTGYAITDHADGNGLNNQRANLREADSYLNAANAISRGGRSVYKGVTWRKARNRWTSRLHIAGKRVRLGHFKSEEDAARAYDDATRQHHGAFGTYNFPRPGERSALTGEVVP